MKILTKDSILEKAEGIVLKTFNYREQDRIITLFTKEHGLISLIVKRISNKNYNLITLTSSFTCGEYLYTRGNTHLYRFQDGTLIEEPLFLRREWKHLETAGEIAQLILKSQMPDKPAPQLYLLLLAYLKQIPFFENPTSLIGSFILKLLHHEGVLPETEFTPLLHIRSFNTLKEIALSPTQLQKIKSLII